MNNIWMSLNDYEKLKDNALVIDVRSENEHITLKTLPNSINIYVYDLIQSPSKYIKDKDQLIITVCNAGNRSSEAAMSLKEQGYKNAYVLTGGIYGYHRKRV